MEKKKGKEEVPFGSGVEAAIGEVADGGAELGSVGLLGVHGGGGGGGRGRTVGGE